MEQRLWDCVDRALGTPALKGAEVFLTTDDAAVEEEARRRYGPRLLHTPGAITHCDRSEAGVAEGGFRKVILDHMLIGEAEACAPSPAQRRGAEWHRGMSRGASGQGAWGLAVGGWGVTVGGWALADGGWGLIVGGWGVTVGGWALTVGGWGITVSGWGATPKASVRPLASRELVAVEGVYLVSEERQTGNVWLARARRARHPNQRSGHLSQCGTPVTPSLGCPFYNCKSTSHSCTTGRSGGEGVQYSDNVNFSWNICLLSWALN